MFRIHYFIKERIVVLKTIAGAYLPLPGYLIKEKYLAVYFQYLRIIVHILYFVLPCSYF